MATIEWPKRAGLQGGRIPTVAGLGKHPPRILGGSGGNTPSRQRPKFFAILMLISCSLLQSQTNFDKKVSRKISKFTIFLKNIETNCLPPKKATARTWWTRWPTVRYWI